MRTEKAVGRESACFIFLLALFLLQPCQWARAGDWYIVPKLELQGQYDSNINFDFVNKRADYIFNVTPAVDLNYESEISKFTGNLTLNGQVFVNNSNLDTINQYYNLIGQHKVTPRLALSFDGGYTRDSTLREELLASGFVMNRSPREAIRARPGFIYDLSPRASLGLNYGYWRVTYQDPAYSPYYQHEVSSNILYRLKNAKTTLSGTLLGRYTDFYTIGNLYRNLGTYAGLEHKFSEEWIINLVGGLNYNWYSTQTAVIGIVFGPTFIQVPLRVTQKTSNVTPYFKIAAKRRWQKTELSASYSVDQAPQSNGTISQFHYINAEITRRLRERLRAAFQANWYYSLSSQQENGLQDMVLYLSPRITYEITKRLSITSSYTYGWRNENTIGNNSTTNRNQIWVYLTFAYPIQYKK